MSSFPAIKVGPKRNGSIFPRPHRHGKLPSVPPSHSFYPPAAMFLAQLPKLLTKVTQWLQKQNIQKCGGELDVLFLGEKNNLRCNRISVENPENPLRSTLSGMSPNRTLSLSTLRDTPGWLPLFVRSNYGFAGLFSCEAFKSGSIHCLRHGVWAVKADPL